MKYGPPILVMLGALCLLALMAWWGWRRRAQSISHLPQPHPVPQALHSEAEIAPSEILAWGTYVATTRSGRPLERVVAHGLGARSRVCIRVIANPATTGHTMILERTGAPSFCIPGTDIRAVSSAPGMVGKWIGGDGLVVVRWQLGEELLDTGVRCDRRADHDRLIALGAHASADTNFATEPLVELKETP